MGTRQGVAPMLARVKRLNLFQKHRDWPLSPLSSSRLLFYFLRTNRAPQPQGATYDGTAESIHDKGFSKAVQPIINP